VESVQISDHALGNEPSDQVNPESMGSNLTTINAANSAQAKAYAQSQINRYIKRLFPNN
jgi:hypothetical protein